jgi:hypothetical protein
MKFPASTDYFLKDENLPVRSPTTCATTKKSITCPVVTKTIGSFNIATSHETIPVISASAHGTLNESGNNAKLSAITASRRNVNAIYISGKDKTPSLELEFFVSFA